MKACPSADRDCEWVDAIKKRMLKLYPFAENYPAFLPVVIRKLTAMHIQFRIFNVLICYYVLYFKHQSNFTFS